MLSGEKSESIDVNAMVNVTLTGHLWFLMSIPYKMDIAAIKLNDHTCSHYSIKDGT